MKTWTPTQEWAGQEAIVIGGGSSLKGFDFSPLKGRNVIGCNEAFKLGADVVKVVLFVDGKWWDVRKFELEKFEGRVVACCPNIMNQKVPWMHFVTRVRWGLQTGDNLGLNGSCGAAAINLALNLGANRIYLLGMDLSRNHNGQSHWHGNYNKITNDHVFEEHTKGFKRVADELAPKYPGVEVFNVTDGTSNLHSFKRISFEEFAKR